MQPKNLGLKFAIVGLLIAMAIYTVWAKGLRQGIDLKGGHVLTFEVVGVQQQRDSLLAKIATGQKLLAEAADAEQKTRLQAELDRYNERLGELEKVDDDSVVQQVIDRLQERIDPNGLYSLEWRRVGRSRFEVRMPLGSEASQKAKQAYQKAFAILEDDNVTRSDIRRVVGLTGAARTKAIEDVSGGGAARISALTAVGKAHDALKDATDARDEAKRNRLTGEPLKRVQNVYDNARFDYESRLRDVLALNINTEELGRALELYVTKAEATKVVKDQVEKRRNELAAHLDDLRSAHPGRIKWIDDVYAAYTDWAELRTGLDDPADLKRLVAKTGVLEFRIAPTPPGSNRQPALSAGEYSRHMDELAQHGPMPGRNRNDRYQWFPLREKSEKIDPDTVRGDYAGKKYILLCNDSKLTMLQNQKDPWSLKGAYPTRGGSLGQRAVGFDFDIPGGKLFAWLTGNNVDRRLAILLDNEVYSAPNIQTRITNRGVITGDFTPREIHELIQILNAGALAGRVNPDPVSEKAIAPSMGAGNREAGKTAAMWGLIGVAVFMLLYYWYAGGIANLALLLNLVLVLGAMSFIEAVFTLPGIAGVILTIGMAVDANVLIFERLREEQAKTQSIRMALRNAYSNAASAILDGNITTLLTCLILGWVGTREVRGFAITLSLGVMFSLFTALVVTRWIFQLLVESNWISSRIRMAAFIGTPKINWMAKRRLFWVLSIVLVVAGVLALVSQGSNILGLQFSSGAEAAFNFKPGVMMTTVGGEPALPERGLIEEQIKAQAAELAKQSRDEESALAGGGGQDIIAASEKLLKRAADLDRLADTAKVETILTRDRPGAMANKFDANADGFIAASEWAAGAGQAKFFGLMDADGDQKLSADEIDDRMPEWTYQVSTTVPDVRLVREVLEKAFGDALDAHQSISIAGGAPQVSGSVPGLMITLDEAAGGKTIITPELITKVSEVYRDELLDFTGGAMFVIRDLSPAVSEADLDGRIQAEREGPHFTQLRYNRSKVIGLEAVEGTDAFSSFAVLAHNPNVDFTGRAKELQTFVDNEADLLDKALQRAGSLGSATVFDSTFAGQAGQAAIAAFVLSWLAIVAYLWIRFGSARWGLAAVVCLVHDVVIALGMVAISGFIYNTVIGRMLAIEAFKIDMAMVAAFLTIIGYSVNDTIVVFDRIRENRGRLTTVDERTINRSINQTISRTLLTTTTTLIAVVVMYTMGGAGIHAFTFALLVGIIFGTYSSIAVASPLLLGFKHAVVGKAMTGPEAVADK